MLRYGQIKVNLRLFSISLCWHWYFFFFFVLVCHPKVWCDGCDVDEIRGMRWRCTECYAFDLCTTCYMNDEHDLSHIFMRVMSSHKTSKGYALVYYTPHLQVYCGIWVMKDQEIGYYYGQFREKWHLGHHNISGFWNSTTSLFLFVHLFLYISSLSYTGTILFSPTYLHRVCLFCVPYLVIERLIAPKSGVYYTLI